MKDLCVWAVGFVMLLFSLRYIYLIAKHKITPTLLTWITFLLGTILSLVTYAIAENHDFRSGILNTVDVISVSVIIITIMITGKKKIKLENFEKWYLRGVSAIIIYGLCSGDAWHSNIFTQVLIGIGYFPTFKTLFTEKKNTESFTAWILSIIASTIALYPALIDGNSLAVLYSTRTIVLVSVLMSVMLYFEIKSKKISDKSQN